MIYSLMIAVFIFLASGGRLPQLAPAEPSAETSQEALITTTPNQITLTPERAQHILYGDATGGGHIYGANKPCKSEFPQDWDADEIIDTVTHIAANDNLPWQQESNGYYTAETTHENVKVRVVLGAEKKNIITAYPLNTSRNACDNR